jgi:hypothetical protein
MQTENQDCIVLILGFNRPEFVEQRVKELGPNPPFHVHISIDGGISSEIRNGYATIEQGLNTERFNISYKNTNLGLVKHVTGEISHLFEKYEYVIVIEDDIQISRNFISDVGKNLIENRNPRIATWGGYSPINAVRGLESLNCWRETHYFSAWGWGISRDHWSYYTTEIDSEIIDQELMHSKTWGQLSSFQKRVWKSRFRKVSINPNLTWDYQMQYMTFKYDFLHKLPILRLTENEGFGDARSTNTKSERPRSMGAVGISKTRIYNKSAPHFLTRILVFIDSLAMSGDSILLKPEHWFNFRR